MITKKGLIVAVLLTFCLTVMLSEVLPVGSLEAGEYDPWLDYDDDGTVDMWDVAASARAFGTSGDSTKNVTVTNWPTCSQVAVWWAEPAPTGGVWSEDYQSSGFCRLHILASANHLTDSESIEVRVSGKLYNEDHTGHTSVVAYTITLTATSPKKDATIFVPGETFFFIAAGGASTTGEVSVSFYLTWA